jgi:hypothetical protein
MPWTALQLACGSSKQQQHQQRLMPYRYSIHSAMGTREGYAVAYYSSMSHMAQRQLVALLLLL